MKTKGLTLKEAVESGRRFKRMYEKSFTSFEDFESISFSKTDIFADDFELEQPEPRTEKRWLYTHISQGMNRPFLSDLYFKSDEDFKQYHYQATWFERIEESGRMFPVLD